MRLRVNLTVEARDSGANGSWALWRDGLEGGEGDATMLANYSTDDLRVSIVYRGRCFRSAAEAERYTAQFKAPTAPGDPLALESVLSRLIEDLAARGRLSNSTGALSLRSFDGPAKRLELALLLLDEYVRYPLPSVKAALIPWNYCAAARLFPWLERPLAPLCGPASPTA